MVGGCETLPIPIQDRPPLNSENKHSQCDRVVAPGSSREELTARQSLFFPRQWNCWILMKDCSTQFGKFILFHLLYCPYSVLTLSAVHFAVFAFYELSITPSLCGSLHVQRISFQRDSKVALIKQSPVAQSKNCNMEMKVFVPWLMAFKALENQRNVAATRFGSNQCKAFLFSISNMSKFNFDV